MDALPIHPYYPLDIEIADYVANEWGTLTLVSIFAAVCAAVFTVTYAVVKKARPNIAVGEIWTILWFVLSGCIHLILEGYYVYHFQHLASKQTLLGQLWKEYALSDSRYLTQDSFNLCMETITAVFWGPLSFLLAGLITKNHHLRHPLQLVVSLGQLYGDVLYYATALFNHVVHRVSYSRPEGCYFWGYFVFMNVFWVVIPSVLLYQSIMASGRVFLKTQTGSNGTAKKVN